MLRSTIMTRRIEAKLTHPHITLKAITAAVLLTAISTPSLANRPSMEDRSDIGQDDQSAPSAVENMMQYDQRHQNGDTLILPAEEIRPGETIAIKLIDLPRRGTSMQKVRQEFGEPVESTDAIGDPPITRWTYNDRVVYFEYSSVIHVVAR